MRSRKAQTAMMIMFTLKIIFAIIVILSVISATKSCFRLTSQAEGSFNELVELMKNTQPGETRSMDLVMDEGTSILGYNANFNRIMGYMYYRSTEADTTIEVNIYEDRPRTDRCNINQACTCLIQKGILFKLLGSTSPEYKIWYDIEEYVCKSLESIKLTDTASEVFYQRKYRNDKYLFEFSQGFMLIRDLSKFGEDARGNIKSRSTVIYVENYNGVVGVCLEKPCIRDEQKQEIDIEIKRKNHLQTKCEVNPSTCQVEDIECTCYKKENFDDAKKAPDDCKKNEYCYEMNIGCENYFYPLACKTSLGDSYIPLKKCEVDDTDRILNPPCTCHTQQSFEGKKDPQICTEQPYCYDKTTGCQSPPVPSLQSP